MKYCTLLFLTFFLALPFIGEAQDALAFDLSYEVNTVYPPLSITKSTLTEARNLQEINEYYKPSWIKEFLSVEITANNNGMVKKAISTDDEFTKEQKEIMVHADAGTPISIVVRYIPDNNLKNNEEKEYHFSFLVDPEQGAEFPGGTDAMKQYIRDQAIKKIPLTKYRQHHLSAIRFAITEEGHVVNAEVAESSGNEETDQILLQTICNMPDWNPAKYASGQKAQQEFVLLVGDRNSCVLNFFNIREKKVE